MDCGTGRTLIRDRREQQEQAYWVKRGRNTSKVEPSPGALLTVIAPLCFLTMLCTTQRPRPVPSVRFFVVKKGDEYALHSLSVHPAPVSLMLSLR